MRGPGVLEEWWKGFLLPDERCIGIVTLRWAAFVGTSLAGVGDSWLLGGTKLVELFAVPPLGPGRGNGAICG